ncbi:MAG TPA: pirin family protein [Rhodopila sp.]|nr:pirin family protein [Rhodopila sp.]
MPTRSLLAQYPAQRDDIGDLVTRRPVPGPQVDQIDPFLFLNHHGPQVYPPRNGGLPFGPHPHRGFETVTFILQGCLAHLDSGGHASVIEAGGVQWMTAGRGLIHAEVSPPVFKREGGPLEILQLWVNLPSRLKLVQPAYVGLQQAAIPTVMCMDGQVSISLIAGRLDSAEGPVQSLTGVFMTVVTLHPGGCVTLSAPAARNVLFYTVAGDVVASGTKVPAFHLVRFAPDGDEIDVEAPRGATLLFGHADPINEPVAAYGPFVMNTQAEIEQAIRDYRAGRFDNAEVGKRA